MKRFNITVNGKAYDVAVEELDASVTPVSAPVQTATPTAAPATTPVKETPVATPTAGDGEKVTSPMPGTILDVKVNVGDTVSRGQAIMILEAMKMENDIVAPCDGTVTSILVNKGDTANSGDVLATIG